MWLAFPWIETLLGAVLIVLPLLALWPHLAVFLPTVLRLLLSGFFVLVVPGYLLLPYLLGEWRPSWCEQVAISVGITLILLCLVCAATLLLGGTVLGAVVFLLAFAWCLLFPRLGRAWRGFRALPRAAPDGARTEEIELSVPETVLVGGLAALLPILYTLGLSFLDLRYGEDFESLYIIRKLVENPSLTLSNYYYYPGYQLAYIFPPFHFLHAAVAKCSALDPIISYDKFRPIAGLLTLIIQYALVRALTRSKTAALVVSLSNLVLTFNCIAGSAYLSGPRGVEWGQFIPFGHYVDFAVAITLQLTFLFVTYLVVPCPRVRTFFWLAPVLILAETILHGREVILTLLFAGSLFGGLLLWRRSDPAVLARLAVVIVAAIGLGLLFRQLTLTNVEIAAWNQVHATKFRELFAHKLQHPVELFRGDAIVGWNGETYKLEIFRKPVFALALAVFPALYLFRRQTWACALLCALASSMLLVRIPLLSILLALATFPAALFQGASWVFPWVYTVFGLLLYYLLRMLDVLADSQLLGTLAPRRRRLALVGLTCVCALALLESGRLMGWLQKCDLDAVYLASAGTLLAALWLAHLGPERIRSALAGLGALDAQVFRHPTLVTLALLLALVALFLDGMGPRARPSEFVNPAVKEDMRASSRKLPTLPELYLSRWQAGADADATLAAFRRRSGMDLIPEALLSRIRGMKPLTVFECPTPEILLIPLYTNQYVTNIGGGYLLDAPFYERYQKEGHPLWADPPRFTEARMRQLLREMAVEYVLLPPRFGDLRGRLEAMGLTSVCDQDGWAILSVTGH